MTFLREALKFVEQVEAREHQRRIAQVSETMRSSMTPELKEKIETLHALAELGKVQSLIHEDIITLAYKFVELKAAPPEMLAQRVEELFAKYVK